MAIERPLLIKEQTLLPIRYLQEEDVIKPVIKNASLGKYIFLYDFRTEYGYSYSKGDVVDAVQLQMKGFRDNLEVDSEYIRLENLKYNPKDYVYDYDKTVRVPLVYLKKVDDSTPKTINTGIGYGNNYRPFQEVQNGSSVIKNPFDSMNSILTTTLEKNAKFTLTEDFGFYKVKPVKIDKYQSTKGEQVIIKKGSEVVGDLIEKPLLYNFERSNSNRGKYLLIKGISADGFVEIPLDILKPSISTPATDKPVITNGIQGITETKSFFDDKNNLLMVAGVLLIGYLLLNDKSE
jgi:hypothetical protein